MRISFTGTQDGCNTFQLKNLENWLEERKSLISLVAHGCCTGADTQFHRLVRKICGRSVFIAAYPSTISAKSLIPEDADFVDERRPPLERNKLIVIVGHDQLLATPKQNARIIRSGTWHAVRYAESRKVPVEIFWRFRNL